MAEAEAVCVLHVCAPLDAAGWGLDKTLPAVSSAFSESPWL